MARRFVLSAEGDGDRDRVTSGWHLRRKGLIRFRSDGGVGDDAEAAAAEEAEEK